MLPVARTSAVARLLTPSFSDIFFVAIVAWCFLSGPDGWLSLLMDGDTGFHIRVGDWILAHRQVPVTHPFSFSVNGHEWFAFEWLAQIIVAAVHSEWGLKGVALGAGLLIGTVFTALLRYMIWRGANPLIAVVATLITVNICRIHFWARPHLFTWLFLVAGLWILERDRLRPSRWTWTLVPLVVIWANLHGGFVLFLVLLGIQLVGVAGDTWLTRGDWSRVRRLAMITGAASLSTLVNPYGLHLVTHVIDVVSAKWLTTAVDEFKSPQFRTEPLIMFMGILFVSLGLCERLIRKRRFDHFLWIAFLAYSALVAVRQAPIFALVAAPIVAVELSELWNSLVLRSARSSIARILDDVTAPLGGAERTGVLCPAFALFLAFAPGLSWPVDFPKELFPITLVSRHGEKLAPARVFTTDQWSDYLIYRNYPKQRDFMDGQHQYYGEQHVKDYVAIIEGQPNWSTLMDRFRFDYVLSPKKQPLTALLSTDARWRRLDEADGAVLFAPAR